MFMFSGKQIRELRLSLKLTLREFGERVGASESAVCLWESEKRYPRHRVYEKLNELAANKSRGKRQKAIA